ncbi:hypothetical protein IR146_08465 [Actinomyces bowdenii]|uniref:Uncharacterized protein n=2 Tax=Actinomyces bowdenii TaxID=131109 RepID=A0A853EJM1_9ACTO|nr:hypothetical protein [Actinomyces bowdenii]NYS69547.1 hypothetical protein [Actinomyces bowdenii]
MIPEATEIERRILALRGTTLTEADSHRFLLDVADLLGAPPLQMLGPGIKFRWLVGDRIIQIAPTVDSYNSSHEITMSCLDYEQVVNNCEYRSFNTLLPPYSFGPYLWSKLLREPPEGWWTPGNPAARTWEEFDDTLGTILTRLPQDIALIPPAWRDLSYRSHPWSKQRIPSFHWNGADEAPWGTIELFPDQEGILVQHIDVHRPIGNIRIPRDLIDTYTVSITKVLTGLTPGVPLARAMSFFATMGFDYCIESIGHGHEDLLEEADSLDDEPPEGISLEELQALIAAGAPERSAPRRVLAPPTFVPLELGLQVAEVMAILDQVSRGESTMEILTARGAQPGTIHDQPALVGHKWSAMEQRGRWEITPCASPMEERTFISADDTIAYITQLSDALEARYGAPISTRARTSMTLGGSLDRLFRLGETGVYISSVRPSIEILPFETLLFMHHG